MKLIGFVLLLLDFGKQLQSSRNYDSNGDFFKYALRRITKINDGQPVTDKCTIQLVDEIVKHFGNTFLFLEDGHLHEDLLRNLQCNFVHSYFTQKSYLTTLISESFYHLLIFGKNLQLKQVIEKINPFQSTKFLVFVKDYQEATESFEILWQHRLVDAVASFVDKADVYYYTYFPYWSSHCSRVGAPYLLAKCNVFTGVFSHREKFFPKKVNNLRKCRINITFVENLPSSYYTKANQLVGWEVDLLSELLERINGLPNYKILPSRSNVYNRREGYQRLVENSEIGGGSAMSLKSLLKTDFCMYGMSVCMVWVVPKEDSTEYSFDFLAKVFPISVWILVLVTYCVIAFAISLLFKVNLKNVLFKLLPFLLGTTTRVKKISRTFGGLWLTFCLIVNAVYQCGYQSRLLVPQTLQKSVSTTEVMNSNLRILGASDVLTDVIPYFKRRYNVSERRFKIRKNFSYQNWAYRMTVRKDAAYYGFKEAAHFYIDKTEMASKVYISETCSFKYLLTLVLKKNSHLTLKITQLANRLNENGFLDFLIKKYLSRESRKNIPKQLRTILKPEDSYRSNELPPPINMQKISVVFMCLAAGASVSLLAFFMELMLKWYSNKTKET